VWAVKILISVVSATRFDASGWEGRDCGSQCGCGERCSVMEEILTGVIARHRRTLVGKVGGRKRKESAVID